MGIEQHPPYHGRDFLPKETERHPGGFPSKPEPFSSRIPRDLKRWPETEGYPPISGGSNLREYYAQYLRETHPEWSSKRIKREVKTAMRYNDSHLWKQMAALFEEAEKNEAFRLFEAFEDIRKFQEDKVE